MYKNFNIFTYKFIVKINLQQQLQKILKKIYTAILAHKENFTNRNIYFFLVYFLNRHISLIKVPLYHFSFLTIVLTKVKYKEK